LNKIATAALNLQDHGQSNQQQLTVVLQPQDSQQLSVVLQPDSLDHGQSNQQGRQ
jgi:hypothetical protein